MKKLCFLFLILLKINFLSAQITISDYNNKQEEKIYPKPIPFNTSSNWIQFESLYEYKQYIGLKVFLPISIVDKVTENRNCIITDILYEDKLKNFFLDFEKQCDSCPKLLNDEKYSEIKDEENIEKTNLLFQVKNEKTNEIFYYTYTKLKNNILVQYFENQQLLFKNKVLIYDDLKINYKNINCDLWLNDIKKIVTSENIYEGNRTGPKEVILKKGSKWTCIDVTLIKDTEIYTDNIFSSRVRSYNSEVYTSIAFKYKMFYVLKNDLEETIAFESLNPLIGEERNSKNNFDPYCNNSDGRLLDPYSTYKLIKPNDPFILESVYIDRERQRKNANKSLLIKQKAEENNKNLKEKNDSIKKQNDLNSKYGSKYGILIAQNKIIIGMTKEMCESSWGIPFSKDRKITATKTTEIWHYGSGINLSFVNDELVQIVE